VLAGLRHLGVPVFTMVFNLAVNIALTIVGIAFGWWIRAVRAPSMSVYESESKQETQRAREALARLHELAARVAADVGEHSHRVEAINEELTSGDSQGTEAVVSVVAKLVEANNSMQRQLASAEGKLQEQARQIETHAAAARTDPLTQLANRRAFDDALKSRLKEHRDSGRPFCVAMIDVDHFKKFNDTYGHLAGDEVLRTIGRVLRRSTRQSDFIARYGGEEFTVVYPGTRVSDACALVERIREAIAAECVEFNGTELRATASIGVAQFLGTEELDSLVERADAALYAAKTSGRNRCHWHDGQTIHPCRPEERSDSTSTLQPEGERKPETPQPTASERTSPEPRPLDVEASVLARTEVEHKHPEAGNSSPLTRLTNRTAFCTSLSNRLAESRRGGRVPSVMLVQLDHYEELRAKHGQPAVELALRTTAKFLVAAIRDMDVVGHYDLGTFAIMFPNTSLIEVASIAERLRRAIASCTLPWESGPLRFSVSLGGAEASPADDLERILRRTEHALDAAIRSGGNSSYYHNGQWSEAAFCLLGTNKN